MNDDASGAIHTEKRRLAAIMFTDIVGFSRQMGADEARTMRLLALHNQVLQQAVTAHQGHGHQNGRRCLSGGLSFSRQCRAVRQQVQAHFRTHNAEKESAEQIHVRIGIHLGDIIQQDGDVFGDGVNIASRLQKLAEPDTICISQKVYEEVEKKLALGTVVSLGRPKLKNIAQRFAGLPSAPRSTQRTTPDTPSPTAEALVVGCGLHTGWVWPGCFFIVAIFVTIRYLPFLIILSTQPLAPKHPVPSPARQTFHRRPALRQHEQRP